MMPARELGLMGGFFYCLIIQIVLSSIYEICNFVSFLLFGGVCADGGSSVPHMSGWDYVFDRKRPPDDK